MSTIIENWISKCLTKVFERVNVGGLLHQDIALSPLGCGIVDYLGETDIHCSWIVFKCSGQ